MTNRVGVFASVDAIWWVLQELPDGNLALGRCCLRAILPFLHFSALSPHLSHVIPLSMRLIRLVPALVLVLLLAGCSLAGRQQVEPTRAPAPTLHPTFTPTAVPPSPTPAPPTDTPPPPPPTPEPPSPTSEQPSPTPEPPTPTPAPAAPQVEIAAATVNLRSGPGTNYSRVTQASRGQRLDILARNNAGDWFQVQTPNGQVAWVINSPQFTRAVGDTAAVAVAASIPTPPPTARPQPRPQPTAAPAQPTQPPAPAYGFDLELSKQYPETNTIRIHLYAYAPPIGKGLPDYSLSVKKDGGQLPVSGVSSGGDALHSWVQPGQDARDYLYNFKVEYQVPPAGRWDVQIVDAGGNPVGPPATFILTDNDQNRELYVRYKRR